MGNSLSIDITDKYVVLNPTYYKQPYVVQCVGGFGCKPFTNGNAVTSVFLVDGEHARVEGWQILRLATEDEVKNKQISYDDVCKLLHKSKESEKETSEDLWDLISFIEDEAKSVEEINKRLKTTIYQK